MVKDSSTRLSGGGGGKAKFAAVKFHIGGPPVSYGLFLNAVITFLIVAAVVYFLLVAPMGKLVAFSQRRKEATERECPECLSLIPAAATRCKFCTAVSPRPAPDATPANGR